MMWLLEKDLVLQALGWIYCTVELPIMLLFAACAIKLLFISEGNEN